MPDDPLRVPDPVDAQRVAVTRVGFRRRDVPVRGEAPRADLVEGGLGPLEPPPPRPESSATPPRHRRDDAALRMHVARTGTPTRALLGTLVATALVVVAVVKPWGTGPGRAAADSAASVAPAAASAGTALPRVGAHAYVGWVPGPALAALGPWSSDGRSVTASCYASRGWRLIVDRVIPSQTGGGSVTSRSWLPVQAVRASSPTDAAIRYVDASSTLVTAIGVCAGSPSAAPRIGILWRLLSDPLATGGRRAYLEGALLLSGGSGTGAVAAARYSGCTWAVTGMIPGCSPSVTWPTGRYVLEVLGPDATRSPVFLGLTLVPRAP